MLDSAHNKKQNKRITLYNQEIIFLIYPCIFQTNQKDARRLNALN